MDYTELPAPPPLNTLVRCFWFLKGNSGDAAPQTVVADGRLELILHLAEPFARCDERGALRVQDTALVSGQITSPLTLVGRGDDAR